MKLEDDAWTTDLPPVDGRWYWMVITKRKYLKTKQLCPLPVKAYYTRKREVWIDAACWRRCGPEYLSKERRALYSKDPIPLPAMPEEDVT